VLKGCLKRDQYGGCATVKKFFEKVMPENSLFAPIPGFVKK